MPVPLVSPLMVGVGGTGVAVTLTVNVPLLVAFSLSRTCKLTLYALVASEQSAETVAVTVPAVF